jgi:hypothetical protein
MFANNSEPEFLVGDLQLNLNLPCVVMKNDDEGFIDNFVGKSGGKYICRIFFLNFTFYDLNGLDSKKLDTGIVHSLCLNIVCWKT